MQQATRTILTVFEVRKTRRQKERFRHYLTELLEDNGYNVAIETHKGLWRSDNVVVGDPATAKLIFTAHYDTCARLPLPNLCTPRNLLGIVLYQLLLAVLIFLPPLLLAIIAILVDIGPAATMGVIYFSLLFQLWWMIDGPANPHTANDNTSGVMTLTELLLTLPPAHRDSVCCVFFDNEEKGLLGSGAFYTKHKKALGRTPLINFDCVCDGDSIELYPQKECRKDPRLMAQLREAFVGENGKSVEVVSGFAFYPSDQKRFPKGIGVCALHKSRLLGGYLGRIHTARDTVMDENNIELLRKGSLRMAECYSEEYHAKGNFYQGRTGE